MQFQVRGRSRAGLIGLLLTLVFCATSLDSALSKTQSKKHPKGYVHDTAGDGKPAPPPADAFVRSTLPKWQQYDAGGLYYYNLNQTEKARQYWMEALRLAEVDVPAERAKGLKPQTADACCKLVRHLLFFVNNVKFKPNYDASYGGGAFGQAVPASQANNPMQYRLDNIKETLRQMYRDWDWYERVGNFADRALGKQRDCLRQVYAGRELFERKIIMTRQSGQQLEQQMGIDLQHTSIDTRPLKWAGVEGAGNPYATPGSNPIPLKYRGGAQSGSLDH